MKKIVALLLLISLCFTFSASFAAPRSKDIDPNSRKGMMMRGELRPKKATINGRIDSVKENGRACILTVSVAGSEQIVVIIPAKVLNTFPAERVTLYSGKDVTIKGMLRKLPNKRQIMYISKPEQIVVN